MEFFTNITSSDEMVKLYRKLALQHHPDRGGDTQTMQRLNAEFEKLMKSQVWTERKQHENRRRAEAQAEGREWKGQTMSQAEVEAISLKLYLALVQVGHLSGLEFEICGDWLWASGDTRPHKDALKAAGFWWSNQKSRWYVQGSKSHSRGSWEMERIRNAYGSSKVGAANARLGAAGSQD